MILYILQFEISYCLFFLSLYQIANAVGERVVQLIHKHYFSNLNMDINVFVCDHIHVQTNRGEPTILLDFYIRQPNCIRF